jgi:hypothetical protein
MSPGLSARAASGSPLLRSPPRAACRALQHLDDGPVGDAVAVRRAATADDCGVEWSQSLGREPGLPDSRIADDRDELAPLLRLRALPRFPKHFELTLTPDERRIMLPLKSVPDTQQAISGNRPCLSLER